MKPLKIFILFCLFLVVTGCASIGPRVVIETPEPAEDILVTCEKTKRYLLPFMGNTHYIVTYDVNVVNSGELVDCGVMFFGEHFNVVVRHPVYVMSGSTHYVKDDVEHIVLNKTNLDLLDEQKAKFEAGYWDRLPADGWDKDKTSAQRYARTIGGCDISNDYLEDYSQVKKVDKDHFVNEYNSFLFECNKMADKEKFKNDPGLKGVVLGADKMMKVIWNNEKWKQYE